MPSDTLVLAKNVLAFLVTYLPQAALQQLAAVFHRWTWHARDDAKTVVVLGGSFAGIELVRRLCETLPTGYRVVLIEKNSHLNYSFVFPRFAVITDQEHKAFIPYDNFERGVPVGMLSRVRDVAVGITESQVLLKSGLPIAYDLLAIATGSSQPLPAQVASTDREDACEELRKVQQLIGQSQRIAVVGGGAVGVELAGDIKDFHPEKEVTLVHSRGELLGNFGSRLREHALGVLRDELGVRVVLSERPKMPAGSLVQDDSLVFSDGHTEDFDLIIGCTGQRPNSSVLATHIPQAVCPDTSLIKVQPTLQVLGSERIFAFGDVADHGGPRMARAGWLQSRVVLDNMLAMVSGKTPTREYKPSPFIEGAIKLTLGRSRSVVYSAGSDGLDVLMPARGGWLDLDIGRAWRQYGADLGASMDSIAGKGHEEAGEAKF